MTFLKQNSGGKHLNRVRISKFHPNPVFLFFYINQLLLKNDENAVVKNVKIPNEEITLLGNNFIFF